jgi:hypothetical protein
LASRGQKVQSPNNGKSEQNHKLIKAFPHRTLSKRIVLDVANLQQAEK